MSILERLVDNSQQDAPDDDDDRSIDLATRPDDGDDDGHEAVTRDAEKAEEAASEPEPRPVVAEAEDPRPDGRVAVRGMRIRRVRLRSVAKIASVFFVLGYLTVVGTLVVVWNAARALGFVDSLEETVTTALGLDDRFTVGGGDLFGLVVVGTAVLMLVGLLLTVLLALVYNVTCALFGGLAVETGPLRRRRRVFSLRHRGFVTIRQ